MNDHTTHHDDCGCMRERIIDEVIAKIDALANETHDRATKSANEGRYQDAARYMAQMSALESVIYRVKKMKGAKS